MNVKRILSIVFCLMMVATGTPIIEAMNTTEVHSKENNNDLSQNESFFLVGIMHVKLVKIPWGFKNVYTPICVLRIGKTFKSRFLGPLSGSIDGMDYRISGYLGFLWLFIPPCDRGFLFICAKLTPN